MLNMLFVDESQKTSAVIHELFKNDFNINEIHPASLDEVVKNAPSIYDLALFVGISDVEMLSRAVGEVRTKSPKTIVVVLMPTLNSDAQFGGVCIPAHKIVFSPCTKLRVLEAVEDFSSLIGDVSKQRQDKIILFSLIEFIGEKNPFLYFLYNRILPLALSLCKEYGCDGQHFKRVLVVYFILLSNMDEQVLDGMMVAEKRTPSLRKSIYQQISKMVDLLRLDESSHDIAMGLKYVLKLYNGKGLPKDDVKGNDIPVASRMVRLLLDYHYLIQLDKSVGEAVFILSQRTGWYDDVLLEVLIELLGDAGKRSIRSIYPLGLVAGMEVAEDIYGIVDGKRRKFLSDGQILSERTVDFIQRHGDDILDITEPIKVVESTVLKVSE